MKTSWRCRRSREEETAVFVKVEQMQYFELWWLSTSSFWCFCRRFFYSEKPRLCREDEAGISNQKIKCKETDLVEVQGNGWPRIFARNVGFGGAVTAVMGGRGSRTR
ncbi:hypothetical protein GBA52_015840 [Prunus armeniaca]|nr:hypothetical protein GBA52_015840 [Prunus armeniaca]